MQAIADLFSSFTSVAALFGGIAFDVPLLLMMDRQVRHHHTYEWVGTAYTCGKSGLKDRNLFSNYVTLAIY